MLNDYGQLDRRFLEGSQTARSALYHVILFLGHRLRARSAPSGQSRARSQRRRRSGEPRPSARFQFGTSQPPTPRARLASARRGVPSRDRAEEILETPGRVARCRGSRACSAPAGRGNIARGGRRRKRPPRRWRNREPRPAGAVSAQRVPAAGACRYRECV